MTTSQSANFVPQDEAGRAGLKRDSRVIGAEGSPNCGEDAQALGPALFTQASDPRTGLAGHDSATTSGKFAAAEYVRFYEQAPHASTDQLKLWYGRGQNFIVGYADAGAGAEISRDRQVDEYVVLVPDAATEIEISWAGQRTTVPGASIVFVPAGDSVIRVTQPGRLVLMFTSRQADLRERCVNARSYLEPHPHIPPFQAWPEPEEGERVRQYRIDVPDEPGRFGRIWRCTTFMVNVLPPQSGPRDTTKLSPHHHDTFEQGSFALDGTFTHHIRWPWTADLSDWRADEHTHCASPSLTVIPPPAIHTSRGMGEGENWLIDIFSPPRHDFSQKAGWVLNESDYPMPSA